MNTAWQYNQQYGLSPNTSPFLLTQMQPGQQNLSAMDDVGKAQTIAGLIKGISAQSAASKGADAILKQGYGTAAGNVLMDAAMPAGMITAGAGAGAAAAHGAGGMSY